MILNLNSNHLETVEPLGQMWLPGLEELNLSIPILKPGTNDIIFVKEIRRLKMKLKSLNLGNCTFKAKRKIKPTILKGWASWDCENIDTSDFQWIEGKDIVMEVTISGAVVGRLIKKVIIQRGF